jgi:hypothetical protein
MTTATLPRSAYPQPVSELLPKARELAGELGYVPSQNRLKTEFRVGTTKARELREALVTPTEPTPDTPVPAEPEPIPFTTAETVTDDVSPLPDMVAEPAETTAPMAPSVPAELPAEATPVRESVRSWPVLLLALPAMVAIWSGWVGLGELTGFGVVHPLPGIWDHFRLNTAITLPIGVETYAAYALRAWLSGSLPAPARRFAKYSAIGSLALGACGQIAYHLLAAAHVVAAPIPVTVVVACFPVAVLGMGAALAHLLHRK